MACEANGLAMNDRLCSRNNLRVWKMEGLGMPPCLSAGAHEHWQFSPSSVHPSSNLLIDSEDYRSHVDGLR